MASLEVGKVQIYTGDGKGKKTAALGREKMSRN
jgi:cob(I)alamin adenosyltransferase